VNEDQVAASFCSKEVNPSLVRATIIQVIIIPINTVHLVARTHKNGKLCIKGPIDRRDVSAGCGKQELVLPVDVEPRIGSIASKGLSTCWLSPASQVYGRALKDWTDFEGNRIQAEVIAAVWL
jgi:hypothetical protein